MRGFECQTAKAALRHVLRDLSVRNQAVGSEKPFTLRFLARELASTPDGLSLFTGLLDGGLLEMLPKLHFTENAFPLELLLESPQRLIDIVVTNGYLHGFSPPFCCRSFDIS